MKTEQIQALENFFKTQNEHWNKFTFDMLCEVLKQGLFENPEQPLQLFYDAETIFTGLHQTPLQAVQKFAGELDKQNLTAAQKLFVYQWVYRYLNNTVYEKLDLSLIKDLVHSEKEKLKAEMQPIKPATKNIRETLKEIIQKELEQLPETLKELEPLHRLNIVCKLAPYVLPKVEAVTPEHGEPD